jgi:hypothetical protein
MGYLWHNRFRSPTIARALGGPCRPHKECKDAGEDIYFSEYFHASGVSGRSFAFLQSTFFFSSFFQVSKINDELICLCIA